MAARAAGGPAPRCRPLRWWASWCTGSICRRTRWTALARFAARSWRSVPRTTTTAARRTCSRLLQGIGLIPRLEVVEGADHYLGGRQREVGELVADFFAEVLPR